MTYEYPTPEERAKAEQEGSQAKSIFDNPYNQEPGWPKPSKHGMKDEILASLWVDGYCK